MLKHCKKLIILHNNDESNCSIRRLWKDQLTTSFRTLIKIISFRKKRKLTKILTKKNDNWKIISYMLRNAFTFRRRNFEMHCLNTIMMIFMQSILNMKKLLNWYVESINDLIWFERSKKILNSASIVIESNLQNIKHMILLNFYQCQKIFVKIKLKFHYRFFFVSIFK